MTRISFVLVAIIVFILEGSCSDSSFFVHEVIVKTPPRPAAWVGFPDLSYLVIWKDRDGIECRKEIQEDDELIIRLKRGQSCGIRSLVFSGNAILRSAGAFYPRGIDPDEDSVLELNYMAGYINEVAICLERLGKNPWVYPLERMCEELILKSVDPWSVPAYEAAEAFAFEHFRIDRYDRTGMSVVLPDGGSWIPESPFCKVERHGTSQRVFLANGLTIFFDVGRKLLVFVEQEKSRFQVIPIGSN